MTNYKKHEDLKQLAISTYRGEENILTTWKEVKTINNYFTGFRAKIYKKRINIFPSKLIMHLTYGLEVIK